MRRGRFARVRTRYVVLAIALVATTPWGANALTRVTSTAARNVTQAVEVVRGEPQAEPARSPRPGANRQHAATRRERQRQRRAAQRRVASASSAAWRVTDVVDGDTIDVAGRGGASETVRLIGIDTPERGACGYAEAGSTLTVMVGGETVGLSPGAVDDRDRYGRMLRYVEVGGVDVGLALIEKGLAVARYDSRDGYGRHPREAAYVAAAAETANLCSEGGGGVPAAPAPVNAPVVPTSGGVGPPGGGAWPGCNEARAAGAAPVLRGAPGYGSHLDGDNDGVGCE